jgi:hypothetical protein
MHAPLPNVQVLSQLPPVLSFFERCSSAFLKCIAIYTVILLEHRHGLIFISQSPPRTVTHFTEADHDFMAICFGEEQGVGMTIRVEFSDKDKAALSCE